jgi:ParB family chromosome partitioning protein
MTKVALGKGLGALIPSAEKAGREELSFRSVRLEQIAPNPMQPRTDFSTERLAELAESIRKDGVIQPLVVRRNGSGYTIIAGERRYRAAKLAGLTEVPIVVLDEITDTRMLELALVENIQRESLNPIELAEAYRKLIDQCGLTQQQLAERVGRSRVAVTNQLRLLGLPDDIKALVRNSKLTEGHARTLLALAGPDEMRRMADRIIAETLSVRDTERQVGRGKRRKRLVVKRRPPALVELETYLKRLLGTAVKITPGLKHGRIEIEYYGNEDLERLLELFRRIEAR